MTSITGSAFQGKSPRVVNITIPVVNIIILLTFPLLSARYYFGVNPPSDLREGYRQGSYVNPNVKSCERHHSLWKI